MERIKADIEKGLSSEQVNERIAAKLDNKVKDPNDKSYIQIIIGNLLTFFNIMMTSIAIILLVVCGIEVILNLDFMIILILNFFIGTFQEIRSKKIVSKLKLLNTAKVTVVRDGENKEVLPTDIVLDDILVLKIGDQIPVDCIVKTAEIVEVNESLLTGESLPVKKCFGDVLYAGSYIVSGKCKAMSDKVGNNTYIHSVEAQAKGFKKPKSQLIATIYRILRLLACVAIPTAIIVFLHEFLSTYNPVGSEVIGSFDVKDAVKNSGFTIAYMIPAGMVLLSSIAMMTGVIKLATKKVLTQDLCSVESLARINVLACDKTGTLTSGEMEVDDIIPMDFDTDIIHTMSSYLSAFETENSTSIALKKRFGTECSMNIIKKIEFSSDRKYSVVDFEEGTFALGAPEYLSNDPVLLERVRDMTSKGMRVVALAKLDRHIKDENKLPKVKEIVALISIRDTIRKEVPETLKWFRENDVDVLVISGDNVDTVSYIAKLAGLKDWDKTLDMSKIEDCFENEELILNTKVFGRVSPEQKAQIVEVLQKNGKCVGMTGDGINDLISLKKADCSIALANGAPATKNLANFVLMDSNFENMKQAVFEGRRVVNNIQRSSTLFVMKDWCWFFITILPLLLGMKHIIEPTVMGIVNVFLTGIGSFFLALEPDKKRIKGNLYLNVQRQAIIAGLFMFMPVLLSYIVGFALNGASFNAMYLFLDGTYGIATPDITQLYNPSMVSVICLATTIAGFIIMYDICKPLSKYRRWLMLGLLGLIMFVILGIPQMYLLNGTRYMTYIKGLEGNMVFNLLGDLFSNMFRFEIYKHFTAYEWISLAVWIVIAVPLFIGLKKGVGFILNKTLFSHYTEEEIAC